MVCLRDKHVAHVIHRFHPLYFEAVCGAPNVRACASDAAPTCIVCAVWAPAPVSPAGALVRAWTVNPRCLRTGDALEVNHNVRMIAVEAMEIVAVEKYGDVLYALDTQARRWPMDLPCS